MKNYLKILISTAAILPLLGCFDSSDQEVTPTEESEIRVAMMVPPRSGLSPLSDDAFKLSRWSTAETLINLNAKGEAEPMLATDWQQVDSHTWQFTLREGVQFHDGSDLDSAAVLLSLTKAMEAAPKPRILDGIHWELEALSHNLIQVKTTFNDPLLPGRLSSPQLAILSANAYKNDGRVVPIKAGTGPFILTEIDGSTRATLERYNDYWGEKASIETIIADYIPDGFSRAAALRTGSVDVVEAVPVSQVAMIDPELIHEVEMPRTNTLYLNNESEVFKQLHMRKAVAYAVDREQIIDMVYENRAATAEGLLGPALQWAAPLRDNDVQPIEKVEANGEEIVIGTFTDRAELPEVAALLKQQLEGNGFKVKLDIREYGQIENDALAGKFDAFILSRATVLDSGDPVAYMQSDFGCQGSFNIGQFCSQAVDEALTYADLQPLGPLRHQAIIDAEKAILSQYAAIPLLHERVIQGESLRVKNVTRDPAERRLIEPNTEIH